MIVLAFLIYFSLDYKNKNVKNMNKKPQLLADTSSTSCTNKKGFGTNPKIKYQQLLKENMQLKQQIEKYQKNWMPKSVLYLCSIFT